MLKEEREEGYNVNKELPEGEFQPTPHVDMPVNYSDIRNKPTGELIGKEGGEKEYEFTTGKSWGDVFLYILGRFPFGLWCAIFLIIIGVFSGRIFDMKNLRFFGGFWLFLTIFHKFFSKKGKI